MPDSQMYDLTDLEVAVLEKILAGNDEVLSCLRAQLPFAKASCREHTGVGQFTDMAFSSPVTPIEGEPSFGIGGVVAEVNGVPYGGGFRLYIEKGLVNCLEIHAFGGEWPTLVTSFSLQYGNGGHRDLDALRLTPGWPK